MKKLTLTKLLLTSIIVITIFASLVYAAGTRSQPSVCCEKTNAGAYCINTEPANCDAQHQQSPTSCETTSYCKTGTCYDSKEGICMSNTPKLLCDQAGGTWDAKSEEDLPQCNLGCCIIVDQAALVPLVRCKRLSSLYGVEIDYRNEIKSEMECIATATAKEKGACVFEEDFSRTCRFETREECDAQEEVETIVNGTAQGITNEKTFYEDYLCSAEELGTDCARQASTDCYEGKVYWLDSCGNRENIYSSDKDLSWNNGRVLDADEICAPNDGTNKNCGNCDYLLGTRCAEFESGLLNIGGGPENGDYYCKKTVCEDSEGNERKNGESWCVYDGDHGKGKDPVGSRHYKAVCVDGEVHVEPCADFRNEQCIYDSIETEDGEFGVAQCRVNMWQTCLQKVTKESCENEAKGDCKWLPPVTGLLIGEAQGTAKPGVGPQAQEAMNQQAFPEAGDTTTQGTEGEAFPETTGTGTGAAITGQALFGGDDDKDKETDEDTETNRPSGVCVPDIPPGFDFWKKGDAQGICGQASAKCIVKFEKPLVFGDRECVENCECLETEWGTQANTICSSLGDCGGYVNYIGEYGKKGYSWIVEDELKEVPKPKVAIGRNIGIPEEETETETTSPTGNSIIVDLINNLKGDK